VKGRPGLRRVLDTELRLRHDLDTETTQEAGDFSNLASVSTGHDNLLRPSDHYNAAAIASFCTTMISEIPLRARASIALNSSSVKA